MSLAIVYSRAYQGVEAPLVTIEVHISNGLPGMSIVGLPEAAVRESRDRVRGAIINSNYQFPARKITVNLAPADLPKEGGRFDLPIAIGILIASGQLSAPYIESHELLGELALSGDLRPVNAIIPAVIKGAEAKRKTMIPLQNGQEACLIQHAEVLAANSLLQVCQHLNGSDPLIKSEHQPPVISNEMSLFDFADVKGQYHAKRALEIAAAGAHSLLMVGPPGTGKTMLAQRLPSILPDLNDAEAAESAAVQSLASQGFDYKQWGKRIFRAPHHTVSGVALVGGGSQPKPGEISLAHHGVLFLDELPEFDRKVLEVLREPMESGRIVISRAARQAEFPARFQLIAAMNPCPCGYHGDSNGACHCSEEKVLRYRQKISGPLMDRIDMHIEVPRLKNLRELSQDNAPGIESSTKIKQRVINARQLQMNRAGKLNAMLSVSELTDCSYLAKDDQNFLQNSMERLSLSNRSYHKVLKLARTIADLQNSENIIRTHLAEAIAYRRHDRARSVSYA